LPKIRDFRGTPKNSFDGRGNYTLGIKDDTIFPEVVFDKVDKTRGFDITIVTSTDNDSEAYDLLDMLGMPFRKN
jgi:large subunit ribosomal protein L5